MQCNMAHVLCQVKYYPMSRHILWYLLYNITSNITIRAFPAIDLLVHKVLCCPSCLVFTERKTSNVPRPQPLKFMPQKQM